jgi:hypoxanthine-DNA glycosylase
MGEVVHEIAPVWNSESRERGFFYMHTQNRFWRVLPAVFGEILSTKNNDTDRDKAIRERKEFLLKHNIALWDVLSSCEIDGASDASIKNAIPNDFTEIFSNSKIRRVFCTGKTAFSFWKKLCAPLYEE